MRFCRSTAASPRRLERGRTRHGASSGNLAAGSLGARASRHSRRYRARTVFRRRAQGRARRRGRARDRDRRRGRARNEAARHGLGIQPLLGHEGDHERSRVSRDRARRADADDQGLGRDHGILGRYSRANHGIRSAHARVGPAFGVHAEGGYEHRSAPSRHRGDLRERARDRRAAGARRLLAARQSRAARRDDSAHRREAPPLSRHRAARLVRPARDDVLGDRSARAPEVASRRADLRRQRADRSIRARACRV